MRKPILAACILLAALTIPAIARAQDDQKPAEPIHFYHLTLAVQELDASGKPINSRSYTTNVSTNSKSPRDNSIRTGSKVPLPSDAEGHYTYIDVGINFDIHEVHEIDRQLSLHIKADISTYLPRDNNSPASVFRHNQWEAPVLIPIGKPTVIFSSDSLESKNAMQIIATATPIP
jgi:hypothetical protein